MINLPEQDPGLKWAECATCKNIECAANLVFCFICVDGDLCFDCLKTHEAQAHTKEEMDRLFAEYGVRRAA